MSGASRVSPVRWVGSASDGYVEMIDQRRLPDEETWRAFRTAEEVADGIRDMVVRGAPAIGVAAAYGCVLAARDHRIADANPARHAAALERLSDARPTAVNLRWALARMAARVPSAPLADVFAEAEAIRVEDIAANEAMGDHGAALMPDGARILTICNTGSLATAGYGTALGVIRSVHRQGRLERVFACETRPYLQGARLTMWELMKDEVPCTLITDNMPGAFFRAGEIDAVIAGADRIAANGDAANKIGTYQLAVLAKHHGVPFYIAAPTSTVDPDTASGEGIPIEERSADEVNTLRGVHIAPRGAHARHPAFDVTPASLITAIITEEGVHRAPFAFGR